jgi:hypothetical protein
MHELLQSIDTSRLGGLQTTESTTANEFPGLGSDDWLYYLKEVIAQYGRRDNELR